MTQPAVASAATTIPHPPPLPRQEPPNVDVPLSISEVSELLGITAHTARYYERAGLLTIDRSQSGHRIYDRKTVERLDFLVRMRTSGMGISELSRYVDLVRDGDSTTEERLQIMLAQRERIRTQIRELERALDTTEYKIATYGGAPTTSTTSSAIDHEPEGTSS
ncbi:MULTISPECIES: MerR family transcriptional regulator [unclassified Brevibacterium]|uniref:MerR family transcriptional regulator n=1 Tax=unclassified Brevibacterium TaxID=2614124 RepID=UPI001E479C47|nr:MULTISPECIES: MerR family transcriptional regulator [unclassified Brevibacterium]MDK8433436.1 MerR family transcriptional regulator [Brevibacterium sp. H-BE7]